tara:strand:+ start:857 stop:1312 length:456 start_codon:yes stop_codon:yes gene_type:complete
MQLNEFLVKAKRKTYASDGEGGERVLDDGSKELSFSEQDFRYRDLYFGFNPFAGEEVVWKNNKPIWVMNYYGEVTSDVVSAKEVYYFLQKAMRRVTKDRPFRGPSKFNEGDFEYEDKNEGTIDCFSGIERILYQGQEVYKLSYHGGRVDRR